MAAMSFCLMVFLLWNTKPLGAAENEGSLARQAVSLLKSRCAGCHGDRPDEIRGEFDVLSRKKLLIGGESWGAALVPGEPDDSPLYQAVTWEDDSLQMPPKENDRLNESEVETIRKWITAGAPWPKETTDPADEVSSGRVPNWRKGNSDGITVATSGGQTEDWTGRLYKPEDVWAFMPIRRPEVPWNALDEPSRRHPIDAFVARRLKEKNLEPAPRADRATLLRRATFDLTGLPPSPEDLAAFNRDDRPNAFEHQVNRLLASPRYGEQMARHWLDVTRYADTSGFANDFERPNAWRYRDYVIRAFNDDKPFDRFTVEQIAGDELDETDPENLIAVGYLRSGPWEHTAMSVAAVTRQQFLDDVTHSVGVTFLGQGLRCAQCHDHKFDPIPTKDYYRMQAVFAPVQFADRNVDYLDEENTSSFARTREWTERRLKQSQDFLAKVRKKHNDAVQAYLKERGVERRDQLPESERPRAGFFGLTKLEMSLEKIHRKRVAYYQRELKRYEPYAFSLYDGTARPFNSSTAVNLIPAAGKRKGPVQEVSILAGGALDAGGDSVTPGVLSAVYGSNDAAEPTAWNTIPESTQGRRLALARWIASDQNTLTARVIVNRVWQWHFGRGIVATPNSFGVMGSRPTHPELLDWLAAWFMDHDWSIKQLHRLIMTSAVYQRSGERADHETIAQADPSNELLGCFPSRRLAAEELRDALLLTTDEMNPEMGGPGCYPEINWEAALQPRHIMGSVAPAYQPSPEPRQRNRRTIYAFRYRTLEDPMLQVFNRPGSEISCEMRDETTVAPQAFSLFNGQFVHDRALALADRLTRAHGSLAERIEEAYRLVYGRPPGSDEMEACLRHVRRMTGYHRDREPEVVTLPTTVRREMVEELTGEPFSWEEELDIMADYQPDLKPWQVDADTRALAELCLVLFNSNEFLVVR
jgi:mono/diheme cytochrome c family protein